MGTIKGAFTGKTRKNTRPRHVGGGHQEAKVEKTRAAEEAKTEEERVAWVAASAPMAVAEDTISKRAADTRSKQADD